MAITNLQVISIPVSDQDRARDFYVNTLGLVLVADQQLGPEMRWVMVAPAGGGTAITLVTWFPSMPAGSLKGTVLETDDLDGDVERLRDTGLAISEIEAALWGRFVTFDDPDGNGIVLQASATGAGGAEVSRESSQG